MPKKRNDIGQCEKCGRKWLFPRPCASVEICQQPGCGGLVTPAAQKGQNKYGARRVELAGRVFDSAAEAKHYELLAHREKIGEITDLQCQVSFDLVVNGVKVCGYVADFQYVEDGRTVVVDVKGVRTRDYVLKRKLMRALHGIEVLEVSARPRTVKAR